MREIAEKRLADYTALVQKSRTWELELSAAQKSARGHISRVRELESEIELLAMRKRPISEAMFSEMQSLKEQLEQERQISSEMKVYLSEVKKVAFQSQEMAKEISERLEQERRNAAEMKSSRDFWIGKYNEAVTSPPSPQPK